MARETASDIEQDGGEMYRIDCEDCDLDEAYHRRETAEGRRVEHHDVRGHRTEVVEFAF